MRRAIPIEGRAAWIILCPACGCGHCFDERWDFDGNLERPTFLGKGGILRGGGASMLVQWHRGGAPGEDIVCHSFVVDGRIEFLPDCTHAMRGQTVELEEFGR